MWARGVALELQHSRQAQQHPLAVPNPRVACPVPGEDSATWPAPRLWLQGRCGLCAQHAPSCTDGLRQSRGSWQGPQCREGAAGPGPQRSLGGLSEERSGRRTWSAGVLSSVNPPSGRLGRGQNEISRCAVAKTRAFFTFPVFSFFPPVLSFWAEKPVCTNMMRTFGQSSVSHDTA